MSAAEKLLLHLSTFAAAATGLLYLWMKYFLRSDDPFSVVHHPWQPHVLALHVLVAPLLIFALGLIMREHVLDRFRDARPHRSRLSGVGAIGVALPMIASGYLMQVLTDPGPRRILALVHATSGAAFALLYAAHVVTSCNPRRVSKGGRARAGRRARLAPARGRLDRFEDLGLQSKPRLLSDRREAEAGWRRP